MRASHEVRAAWRHRDPSWSRPAWALVVGLGRLPWPWGERIFAACYAVNTGISPTRRGRLLAWARRQRPEARWRLALAFAACHGRFIARAALVGMRDFEA